MHLLSQISASRTCPLCEGTVARVIWSEQDYDYVRCISCGAIYSDIAAHTYAAIRHNAWDEENAEAATLHFYGEARSASHEAFLAQHPPCRGKRLLDVGCGLGFFLSRAQAAGWEVTGCDTSPSWVKHARSLVGDSRVVLGEVGDPALATLRFDLITAWDVVEHIFDPLPFLQALVTLLAVDGRLFLRTPNFAYVGPIYALRQTVFRNSSAMLGPTNHVVYFTASTVNKALQSTGLQPSSWRVYPPPQVPLTRDPVDQRGITGDLTIRAKNAYRSLANTVALASSGRILLGSDLDVEAERISLDSVTAGVTSP